LGILLKRIGLKEPMLGQKAPSMYLLKNSGKETGFFLKNPVSRLSNPSLLRRYPSTVCFTAVRP